MVKNKYEPQLIIGSLWLLMFASSSQFFIMPPILPQICSQLEVSENLLGFLITAYAFALGIMALLAGYVSDNVGRRKILLWGAGSMSVFLIAHSLAFNFYSILVIRVLTGFAGGILTGSCVSYVRDYYPYNKRGWANGMIASASGIGQIIAIPVGVLLGEKFGFSSPFVIFGVVMLLSFILVYLFVPDIKLSGHGNELKLLEIFKSYGKVISKGYYKRLSLIYIFMYLSITVFLVYYPKWITVSFKGKAEDIALMFLAGGIASLVASPLIGKLSDVYGRRLTIILSNIILVAVMVYAAFSEFTIIGATVLFSVLMFFVSGRLVSVQSFASDITTNENRGQVICLMIAIGQIGMSLGSAIAGYIFTELGFYFNLIVGAMSSLVVALLFYQKLIIPSKKPSFIVIDKDE